MSHLSLALLGPPVVLHAERLVAFPTRKTLALLAYLAVEGGTHSREKIAALLWPESGTAQARTTLRSTLALLRAALGDSSAHLTTTRDTLAFDIHSDHALDIRDVRNAARTTREIAEKRTGGSKLQPPTDGLWEAVALWRGDFLDGFSLGDAADFDD